MRYQPAPSPLCPVCAECDCRAREWPRPTELRRQTATRVPRPFAAATDCDVVSPPFVLKQACAAPWERASKTVADPRPAYPHVFPQPHALPPTTVAAATTPTAPSPPLAKCAPASQAGAAPTAPFVSHIDIATACAVRLWDWRLLWSCTTAACLPDRTMHMPHSCTNASPLAQTLAHSRL